MPLALLELEKWIMAMKRSTGERYEPIRLPSDAKRILGFKVTLGHRRKRLERLRQELERKYCGEERETPHCHSVSTSWRRSRTMKWMRMS